MNGWERIERADTDWGADGAEGMGADLMGVDGVVREMEVRFRACKIGGEHPSWPFPPFSDYRTTDSPGLSKGNVYESQPAA
jgi:hypothetical protein